MESEYVEHEKELLIPRQVATYSFGTTQNPALILIEPRQPGRSRSTVQLETAGFGVIAVYQARDIYLMSGAVRFSWAVLSDEIGSAALRASAEAVRWQWPRTRILILGSPKSLEDHLYDDSIPHSSDTNILLGKLEGLPERSEQAVNTGK